MSFAAVIRQRTTPRSVAIGLFISAFAAVGAFAPFLPVYYQSLGLDLDAIGLLAAAGSLAGLVSAPAWGMLADQVSGARGVLLVSALASAACAVGLALTSQPAVAAVVAILFWLAFAGIAPVLDAFALELVAADQHRYARLRVWGSASFVVSTVGVGWLIGQTELRSFFIVLVAMLSLTAFLALLVPRRGTVRVQHRLTGLRHVLRNRTLMSFVSAALIVWSAATAINGFLSIYLIDLNAPAVLVGSAWALGALVEVPVMIAFPPLAARFGLAGLVVLGALMLLLRGVVVVVTSDPLVVTAAMALHGVGYALLLVGGVTYVARYAPKGSEATAQGVLSGVVLGLSWAVGPGVGGLIAGALGLEQMFVLATLTSLVGVVAVALAVRLRPRDP
jgi:MFS transporter, PPP family, 3-phenylpropionic acid transporter